MNDLPYYCHVCSRVIYIEERIECPYCRESFLELHIEDPEEPPVSPCSGGIFGFNFFGCRRKPRTITSDRRNYAIGPEIDDIISRLRDERGIKENPATEIQKSALKLSTFSSEDACSICFCSFDANQKGYLYPCAHYFHQECSDAWLKLQSDCPLCRKPL